MKKFLFSKEDVRKDRVLGNRTFQIGVNGPCRDIDKEVLLVSRETGKQKLFVYDKHLTSELYEMNEGWDGEQHVNVFYNDEFDTTLYVWQTPYQKFTFVNNDWVIEEMY